MYETQLESDFKQYLTELSLGVVRKFGRWLETEGGRQTAEASKESISSHPRLG